MAVYNRTRIFSNRHDSLDGLQRALERRFRDISVEVVGCVAIFAARM
jgi:hypothetical protein